VLSNGKHVSHSLGGFHRVVMFLRVPLIAPERNTVMNALLRFCLVTSLVSGWITFIVVTIEKNTSIECVPLFVYSIPKKNSESQRLFDYVY